VGVLVSRFLEVLIQLDPIVLSYATHQDFVIDKFGSSPCLDKRNTG
jgi:hypothetical protein